MYIKTFFRFLLPHSCDSPVERHHAARDGHVHWDLRRHPSYQDHLLARVGMESWIVHILRLPQLILREAGGNDSLSRKWQWEPQPPLRSEISWWPSWFAKPSRSVSERWWELWFLIIYVFWALGLSPEPHTDSVGSYHWSSWQPWLQWTSQTHAPQLPVIWKITESNMHTKEYSAWKYSLS